MMIQLESANISSTNNILNDDVSHAFKVYSNKYAYNSEHDNLVKY